MTESASTSTRSVIVERVLPHPPAKVWRALTESGLISQWLMNNDFKPVVGHKFEFRYKPMQNWNGVTACRVLSVEPQKRLSYTWEGSGEERADGMSTVVTWILTPEGAGTRLRLEHTGFRPQDDGMFQGVSHGWPEKFDKLAEVTASL